MVMARGVYRQQRTLPSRVGTCAVLVARSACLPVARAERSELKLRSRHRRSRTDYQRAFIIEPWKLFAF